MIRLAITAMMLCIGIILNSGGFLVKDVENSSKLKPEVLQASTESGTSPSVSGYTFKVNVPAEFNNTVTFNKDIIAPNLVSSVNGDTGDVTVDNSLTAGSGITISGRTITNSGIKSLTAGTNIEIVDGNKINNTYSIDITSSGWTDNGTSIVLTTTTDTVTVGTFTAGAITATSLTTGGLTLNNNLTVASGYSLLPSTDLGSDIGSASLRFNNLYVGTINSNASSSYAGQAIFTYEPTDTTLTESSVLINPTSPVANGQLLALSVAGYQKALIDEDGDMVLGYYNSGTAAPAFSNDYPLAVYGHNTTNVSFVDTSGNAYFGGNVGVGTGVGSAYGDNNLIKPSAGSAFLNLKGGWGYAKITIGNTALTLIGGAQNGTGGIISFRTGGNSSTNAGTERMRISEPGGLSFGSTYVGVDPGVNNAIFEGNVGIGITNPTYTLDLKNGSGGCGQAIARFSHDSGSALTVSKDYVIFPGYTDTPLYIAGYCATNKDRVGIGDTNPGAKLEISASGAATDLLMLSSNDANDGDLFVVKNSGNVGIGTTSPTSKLHLTGKVTGKALAIFDETGDQDIFTASASGSPKLTINHSGYVGIGTTAPRTQLDLTGNISLNYSNGIYFYQPGTTTQYGFMGYNTGVSPAGVRISAGSSRGVYLSYGSSSNFAIYHDSGAFNTSPVFIIDNSNNVGIGTTSPGALLHISGASTSLKLDRGAAQYSTITHNSSNQLVLTGWTGTLINPASASAQGLIIGSQSGQTGNLLEINSYGSTGGNLFLVNSSGNVGIGTTSPYTVLSNTNTILTDFGSIGISQYGLEWYINNTAKYASFIGNASSTGHGMGIYVNSTSNSSKILTLINGTSDVATFLANGNVGIGTTSPQRNLHIFGTGTNNTGLQINNSSYSIQLDAFTAYSSAYIGTNTAHSLRLRTSGTDRLTIDSSGNVGIGTTNPQYKLDVLATGTGVIARFNSDNSSGCTLADGGTISCSSDRNLKKDITSIEYGLSDVMKLNPVSFRWNWNDIDQTKSLGFIAQDVEQILPQLVSTDDSTGLKVLNTTSMIPLLAKAIQEQQIQIGELQELQTTKDLTIFQTTLNTIQQKITELFDKFDALAERFTTKEICLNDDGGEVCVDKNKLQEILDNLPSPTPSSSAEATEGQASPSAILEATPSATPTLNP